jgi:hypothetical protein
VSSLGGDLLPDILMPLTRGCLVVKSMSTVFLENGLKLKLTKNDERGNAVIDKL